MNQSRGEMLLFRSELHHRTIENNDDDIRITIAMDIYPYDTQEKNKKLDNRFRVLNFNDSNRFYHIK